MAWSWASTKDRSLFILETRSKVVLTSGLRQSIDSKLGMGVRGTLRDGDDCSSAAENDDASSLSRSSLGGKGSYKALLFFLGAYLVPQRSRQDL